MDYLGKLYFGGGRLDSTTALRAWFRGPMADIRDAYRSQADMIIEHHRDPLVHEFAPNAFYMTYDDDQSHLMSKAPKPGQTGKPRVSIDVPTLISDFQAALIGYAAGIASRAASEEGIPMHGSELAFNVAWWQMHEPGQVRSVVKRLGATGKNARLLYLQLQRADLEACRLSEGDRVILAIRRRAVQGTIRTKGTVAWLGPTKGTSSNESLTKILRAAKLAESSPQILDFLCRA